MSKNKKFYTIISIILISIIMSLVFYLLVYSVDMENIDDKLGQYIDKENVKVISINEIKNFNGEYIIVHYEVEESIGVALLNYGPNNKYRINSAHYSDKEVTFVKYIIENDFYFVAFGKSSMIINKTNTEFKGDYILSIKTDKFAVAVNRNSDMYYFYNLLNVKNYNNTNDLYKPMKYDNKYLNTGFRSSGPKEIIYIVLVSIVSIAFIVIIVYLNIISKKFRKFESNILLNDQRIKQFGNW